MNVNKMIRSARQGRLSRRDFTRTLLAAGIVPVMSSPFPRRAMASDNGHATVFTWGGFDVPELYQDYIDTHGDMPDFAIFGAPEDGLTRLRSGFVTDLIHPCMGDIPRWRSTGLFQPIDISRLSNWPDVIPSLYDAPHNLEEAEGGVWQVPFDWGQTSITYRTDLYDLEGEESWDILWDERYAGRIGMLATGDDAWWCAAIKAGVPFDEIHTDDAFEAIAAVLREQRPLVRTYTDDTSSLNQALAAGEMVAAMTWNSSAVELTFEDVPVRFAQPKEGALTWVCGFMLHKDAPSPDRAYDALDALLSVSAGEFLTGDYGYGHANARVLDLFDDEDLAALTLSRDPMDILDAGHRSIPQPPEWSSRMNTLYEQIKAGF
ncbi:MAG: extracellular solute-binding protein [Rhodobacteraceae bacterium]|nr:extracellular solute-binding protein [Paracoccaceae bacterium]TVR46632.1 MAG: extracellular solute-binding protein [Paracoccaceae bacterium]